jgi:hypothetical protein
MRVILFSLTLFLTGCFTAPKLHIERVEVPIAVPCNIIPPAKRPMPFTDAVNEGVLPSADPLDDLFRDVKRMLAEIKNRQGYEAELEAAIKACNSK